MQIELLHKLDTYFKKNPIYKGIPSSLQEIKLLESKLKIPLPKDYIQFLNTYGGSVIGSYMIHGIKNSEIIGEDNFIELTKGYIKRGYPLKNTHCVISDDGAGNPIFINSEHMVLIYDHNNAKFEILVENFEEFIKDLLENKII